MPDGQSFDSGLVTLYCGNKAYSSWSLRAWLAMSLTGLPFGQFVVPLGEPDSKEMIRAHSPSGQLPALRHGQVLVWDSLAIFEYLAETVPEAQLWPADKAQRAHARAICAEMHAGFPAIRRKLPFNIRSRPDPQELDFETRAEVDRIAEIWRECLTWYGRGKPFLFGDRSLADAMFAPVAIRFRIYGVPLDAPCRDYREAIWHWPEVQQWREAALKEPWTSEEFEL